MKPNHLQMRAFILDQDFEDILALAAQVCEAPLAYFLAADGRLFAYDTDRGLLEVIDSDGFLVDENSGIHSDLLVVKDATKDNIFANSPYVLSSPFVRFFTCICVFDSDSYLLGYLLVASSEVRSITERQLSGLRRLGRQLAVSFDSKKEDESEVKRDSSSTELMSAIFRNAVDSVVVMDENWCILQWNPKAERTFGWAEREVKGKDFHTTVLPARFHESHFERLSSYQTNNSEVARDSVEIIARNRDGIEFPIALGISLTVLNGKHFFIGFINDITDRISAASILDKQKEFYENILNSLPTDIAVFDANHKYLFVNPGAIKDEEYRKFIVGKDDFEYCEYRKRDKSLAELRRAMFLEVKETGKEIRWEDTVKDPEGNPFTSLRRIFPVYDDRNELSMVIGFGIDITERKILEEKQNALVNQLSAQNTQLVDFCNIVSHNLRAPLVNMSMLAEYIQESEDEDEKNDLISKLSPVIESLHATFNELVESIQIKQDHDIKSENIVLADCLKRVLGEYEMEITKTGAVVEMLFDEAPAVRYPHKYLFSIFQNLMSNALKYHSPKRKPLITVQTKKLDDKIILTVADNGLGVDLEKHKDNFFKIGKVFHRHPNAKGFGLFMTKTQVEAMDGKIWVESTLDVGTTFFIEFKTQSV